MLFNKPLASIDEQDIQSLVLDQVPESKTIDYKQGLPGDEQERVPIVIMGRVLTVRKPTIRFFALSLPTYDESRIGTAELN